MHPPDELLARRLLEEQLISNDDLEAFARILEEAEEAGKPPPHLAQELLRNRRVPAWRIGQALLEIHSGAPRGSTTQADLPEEGDGRPAAMIGRFPVTGHLGAGGMGEVLAVRDPFLGRLVAAKTIRGTASQPSKARFIQEAQITGMLEHPSIVPVHELGMSDDGQIFYTMKRVEGEDLARALRHRPMFELLRILLKVCDALAYAHSRGIIHRDLKPANVMVGRFGEVQVLDWGLAKVVGQAQADLPPTQTDTAAEVFGVSPHRTHAGAILGTFTYMAPEQADGRIDQLDARTDIYALGAMLYEILAGQPAFSGDTAQQVRAKVLAGRFPPPQERAPGRQIPDELQAVTLKAMALAPRQRYGSVLELQRDIEAFLEGGLLQAANYSSWQVLRKWAARNKAAVTAAAGILLSVVGALVGISWQLREANRAKRLAEQRERQVARAYASLKEERRRVAQKTEEADSERNKHSASLLVRRAHELHVTGGGSAAVQALLVQADRLAPGHYESTRLRGQIALDRQQWQRARDFLEQALRKVPKDHYTHYLMYRWYHAQGKGDAKKARHHILEAAKYSSAGSAFGLLAGGHALIVIAVQQKGDKREAMLRRAVGCCTSALSRDKSLVVPALALRSLAYVMLREWGKAEADLNRAMQLAPTMTVLYVNRATVHRWREMYDAAEEDYTTALGLSSSDHKLYEGRGQVRGLAGKHDAARADFTEAIRLAPGVARLFRQRGGAYLKLGRLEPALADLNEAIRLDSRSPKSYVLRGRVHDQLKRVQAALHDYDQAIRLLPGDAEVYYWRGVLRAGLGRHRDALTDFNRANRLQPGVAKTLYRRGLAHYLLGQERMALADFDATLRVAPSHLDARFYRGLTHYRGRRLDRALADLNKTIARSPTYPRAHLVRGLVHGAAGRHREATRDYERALSQERDPARVKLIRRLLEQVRAKLK